MHKEFKWCAVILGVIIAIATIAGMFYLPVPGYELLPEEGPAITRVPAEMPEVVKAKNLDQYKNKAEEPEAAPERESGTAQPISITIKVDGMEMDLMSAPVTVADFLKTYGIPMSKDDIAEPALDTVLTEDTELVVQRIVFQEVVESEAVPFKTKVEGTDELPAGTEKVVQKGQKGEDEVTYKITYADGKEISRKEIKRKRVKDPVTKIIKKSTVGTINGAEYSRKFTVKAYSYTGGGRTASGLPAAVGRIAVDPSVIPLGTRVYVEGYGFATAADTGGNIKGNTIDVYYNSASQCRSWGCRYITIYILK